MLVLGLTGGIASGKSTVSKQLHAAGLPVVDADVIARQVVEPGKKAYFQIIKAFQDVEGLVNDDKSLNRAALGGAVFGNKEKLAVLNKIVHGAVIREIVRQIVVLYFKGTGLVVLDVPLLFETKLNLICGTTVAISCLKNVQIERLLARNPELSEQDAQKRIDSQMSTEERDFRADTVISNDGTLAELDSAVAELAERLKPSVFWTLANLFPPFGILNAVVTVAYRGVRDYRRTRRMKRE